MKRLLETLGHLAGLAVIAVLLHMYVITAVPMHGNNMYPAIRDGDLCIVFRLGKIRQNGAVVYEHEGKKEFGRVAAVAGSTATMAEDGSFMIDGYIPAEEIFYPTMPGEQGRSIKIRDDEWLILNDFRTEQNDSRTYGCIKTSDIKGTVIFIFRWRGI